MKLGLRILMSAVICFACASSGEAAQDIPFSGFFGNQTIYEQLKPGPKDGAKLRWLKKGLDPAKYDKFMIDSVVFFFADNADYKGIDPQDMKELADAFNKEIITAFQGKYSIVSEPGPDVLRLRIAITNIQPSRPGVSAVTSIVPVGLGISLVRKGATGGWSGSGQTCAEFMAMDSVTNEIIGLGIDQQKAAFEQRFSKWGSATDAFRFWAEHLAKLMDLYKGIKK